MKKRFLILMLALCAVLCGCVRGGDLHGDSGEVTDVSTELGGFDDAFGETFSDGELYENVPNESDIAVTYVSGTADCYTLEGDVLTFGEVTQDTVYAVSGSFVGKIVIDAGDAYKFDLELCGVAIACGTDVPITVLSGDEVSITAKKDTENYIYDLRDAVGEEGISGALHSESDLEICGKGALTVVSSNNNGIHSKDDLQVKNLTLFVHCVDNALKGNDSVEMTDCNTTLIATAGDGIKTSASDVSDKGNQRGTVTLTGGTHTVYAACDGIDAAYDVVVDGETELNIYTDKYSAYSTEVTASDEDVYYIRISLDAVAFSVKFTDGDEGVTWENAVYHSAVSGGRSQYRYYTVPKHDCASMQIFLYDESMVQGQEEDYLAATEPMVPNAAYDTVAFSTRGNSLTYGWTNYTTSVQEGGPGGFGGGRPGGGPGGMQEGNPDKGDHSTKGIKAANAVYIKGGSVTVKSYDDAVHANNETPLENGDTALGNVTVSGGVLTLYSNDDGLHADGVLTVSGGTVSVLHSYEGMEGSTVSVTAGDVSVVSSDDGINSTSLSGEGVRIAGGTLFVYAGGDGIDSNSRDSYKGIVFAGGDTVVISQSGGNSAIDTERGYAYEGGRVLALMPSGGMTSEATHCSNFSSVATKKNVNASGVLCVKVGGETVAEVGIPNNMSGIAIYLGSTDASFESRQDASLDGANWK